MKASTYIKLKRIYQCSTAIMNIKTSWIGNSKAGLHREPNLYNTWCQKKISPSPFYLKYTFRKRVKITQEPSKRRPQTEIRNKFKGKKIHVIFWAVIMPFIALAYIWHACCYNCYCHANKQVLLYSRFSNSITRTKW